MTSIPALVKLLALGLSCQFINFLRIICRIKQAEHNAATVVALRKQTLKE